MAPRKNTMTAFDSIMQEFLSEEQGPELLEEGMLIQKGKNRIENRCKSGRRHSNGSRRIA